MRLFEIVAEPYNYSVEVRPENVYGVKIQAVFTTKQHHEVSARIAYNPETKSVGLGFTRNGQYELTGQGDQFKILVTVVDFFKQYLPKMISEYNPEVVYFSGDVNEKSRIKLYSKRGASIVGKILGSSWVGPTEKIWQDPKSGITDLNFIWNRKTA